MIYNDEDRLTFFSALESPLSLLFLKKKNTLQRLSNCSKLFLNDLFVFFFQLDFDDRCP